LALVELKAELIAEEFLFVEEALFVEESWNSEIQ